MAAVKTLMSFKKLFGYLAKPITYEQALLDPQLVMCGKWFFPLHGVCANALKYSGRIGRIEKWNFWIFHKNENQFFCQLLSK